MTKKLPKNVYPDRDRHGNVRLYFRAGRGRKVRLREDPDSEAFKRELACAQLGVPYENAQAGKQARPARVPSREGSLDWLIDAYEKRGLPLISAGQAYRRARLLRQIADWKKDDQRIGGFPFALMERRHVVEVRDSLKDRPGARNNVTKALSAMFGWAIEAGLAARNPAARIKKLKSGNGWHTWTVDEIDIYVRRHPRGTMAYRALAIFLFTGLRISDAAIAGRQHRYTRIVDGRQEPWLKIRPGKTSGSSGVLVDIPVLPELLPELDAAEGDMTFITREIGGPYTGDGLGNKMRAWCDAAGLPHCSAHGLRKAGATIAAENGADQEVLKAIYGWTTAQQADLYVRAARRQKSAARAGQFLKLDR